MAPSRHLIIRGRVQGVGFRYSLCQEALRLGLAGWVRNRQDGSVEAVAQGTNDALDALLDWARTGPSMAHVTEIECTNWHQAVPADFTQYPTV